MTTADPATIPAHAVISTISDYINTGRVIDALVLGIARCTDPALEQDAHFWLKLALASQLHSDEPSETSLFLNNARACPNWDARMQVDVDRDNILALLRRAKPLDDAEQRVVDMMLTAQAVHLSTVDVHSAWTHNRLAVYMMTVGIFNLKYGRPHAGRESLRWALAEIRRLAPEDRVPQWEQNIRFQCMLGHVEFGGDNLVIARTMAHELLVDPHENNPQHRKLALLVRLPVVWLVLHPRILPLVRKLRRV